jgi:membrane-associated phospholipid phosphatase
MEFVWTEGIKLIVWLQKLKSPLADYVARFFTIIGTEEFYLLLTGSVYWCGSGRDSLAARLTYRWLISGLVNADLKDLLDQPRPFEIDPGLQLIFTRGRGMPSGHAQSAVVVWGTLAAASGRRSSWAWSLALVLLISLSRVYLGVHFPTDILGGWAVGIVLLIAFERIEPKVRRWLHEMNPGPLASIALTAPLLLALVFLEEDAFRLASLLSGFGLGLVLASGYRWPLRSRVLRLIVGGLPLITVYSLLKWRLLPLLNGSKGLFFSAAFVGFWLTGFWITLGTPWFLKRLTPSHRVNGDA